MLCLPFHYSSTFLTSFTGFALDGAWGRRSCSSCGLQDGVRMDEDFVNSGICSCQRDSVIISPESPLRTYTPGSLHPKLAKTRSDTKLSLSRYKLHRPHTVQDDSDPIPKSGAFYRNWQGHFISVDGPVATSSENTKLKRTGFAKGRIKPNINRQQREKRALLIKNRETVKQRLPMAITNSLS